MIFYCSVIARSPTSFLFGRRGNLIHPACHSEESGVFAGRGENLII
ncbi:hypothetical protein [Atribacter laminatus]|nr:hypothetical protein [Atribacter laminatus]